AQLPRERRAVLDRELGAASAPFALSWSFPDGTDASSCSNARTSGYPAAKGSEAEERCTAKGTPESYSGRTRQALSKRHVRFASQECLVAIGGNDSFRAVYRRAG